MKKKINNVELGNIQKKSVISSKNKSDKNKRKLKNLKAVL